MDQDDRMQWGATAFVFVFLGLLLLFVFLVSRKPTEPEAGNNTQTVADAAESFWAGVEQRAPTVSMQPYSCPVDGTQIEVPHMQQDNRLGGVATDLMKIALAPPEQGGSQPDLSRQEWDLRVVSCPTCSATYMEIDLVNLMGGMVPGAEEALKSWDLASLAPGIAATPQDEWTSDQRQFARYLTHKQAGFPITEQAYAALLAAYASNFSVWYGRDYAAPSSAYYALAAELMEEDLERGLPENEMERALVMMAAGEYRRLLGQDEAAAALFAGARDLNVLDESALGALSQLESALESGDNTLMRLQISGMKAPPVGWYLDIMLPSINGHIIEHRDTWAAMTASAEIESAILALPRMGQ